MVSIQQKPLSRFEYQCIRTAQFFLQVSLGQLLHIFHIQPTLDGLKIDPCIPAGLEGYTVERTYRGVHYHITIDNSGQASE